MTRTRSISSRAISSWASAWASATPKRSAVSWARAPLTSQTATSSSRSLASGSASCGRIPISDRLPHPINPALTGAVIHSLSYRRLLAMGLVLFSFSPSCRLADLPSRLAIQPCHRHAADEIALCEEEDEDERQHGQGRGCHDQRPFHGALRTEGVEPEA